MWKADGKKKYGENRTKGQRACGGRKMGGCLQEALG